MISESEVPRKEMPALAELGVQLDGVGQVAVVGERDLAAVVAPDRLGVLPGAAAGRRVADVADRHRPGEALQLLLVEDLRDEPEVAQGHDHPALAGGDARRLLAAVLERVEAEVGQARDVVSGRVDAEHAAFIAGSVAVVEGPLGQEEVGLPDRLRQGSTQNQVLQRRLAAPGAGTPCAAQAGVASISAPSERQAAAASSTADRDRERAGGDPDLGAGRDPDQRSPSRPRRGARSR